MNPPTIVKENLRKVALLIAASVLLLLPAIYNGFPLLYPDTGTYLFSALSFNVPGDRPVFYGLFIGLFSMGFTLWTVVFVQNLILAFLLQLWWKKIFNQSSSLLFLLIILALSCFTNAGWISNLLTPDIFTCYVLLSLPLLVVRKTVLPKPEKLFLLSIVIVSVLVHTSVLLIALEFAFLILLIHLTGVVSPFYRKNNFFSLRRILFILLLVVVSISANVLITFSKFQNARICNDSNVFLLARFAENGVLKKFMDDNCEKKHYQFCGSDNLQVPSGYFLWVKESPLNLAGDWNSHDTEYSEIVSRCIKEYPMEQIESSFSSTFFLLSNIRYAEFLSPIGINTSANTFMKNYVPGDLSSFHKSKQEKDVLKNATDVLAPVNFYFLIISLVPVIAIIVLSFFAFHLRFAALQVVLLMIGIIINANVCATFSTQWDSRYNSRAIWLLAFAGLSSVAMLLIRKKIIHA